jgi:Arc/MetJ-type ribon-helix-helix transcriptional regulator
MKKLLVLVPEYHIRALDNIVSKGLYPNRNEAIRNAIRDFLKLHKEI